MNEFVLSVPFDAIIEAFGNGEDIEELYHSAKHWLVVADDWRPAKLRGIVELHSIDQGNVGLDWANVWNNCSWSDDEQKAYEGKLFHRIINYWYQSYSKRYEESLLIV